MLLGLVVVSGIFSEAVMRGLRLAPVIPEDLYAGRPTVLGATVANRKRWTPSYSIALEVLAPTGAVDHVLYLPRVEAGGERIVTWSATPARRGRQRLPGLRVTTRFPFGVFLKSGRVILDEEIVVFPAVTAAPSHLLRQLGGAGSSAMRRRGRGHDLHNLRDYLPGDDPRLIHWRSTAKTQTLTVREMAAETALDTRIVLEGAGRDRERLEAGLSEAASVAVHLLRAGASVELIGAGLSVVPGRGRAQERRLLMALAVYEPHGLAAAATMRARRGRPPGAAEVREIHVGIG
jgi:uncharacterized protein (DUF58 family)